MCVCVRIYIYYIYLASEKRKRDEGKHRERLLVSTENTKDNAPLLRLSEEGVPFFVAFMYICF